MERGHQRLMILDFGSQYTQLIARRVRELGVYSEVRRYDAEPTKEDLDGLAGVIFSGGPDSVYDEKAPTVSPVMTWVASSQRPLRWRSLYFSPPPRLACCCASATCSSALRLPSRFD